MQHLSQASTPPIRTLWRNARMATMQGGQGWGWLEDAALLECNGRIVWVGPGQQAPAADRVYDVARALITPGLIDAHTHLVYGGHRAHEFERRLQGVSYETIALEGGGIRSTVAATRQASDEALLNGALHRAKTLLSEGVTALEVKSGYGLSLHDEARCLRTARALAQRLPITVRATGLAAHALPPEFDGRSDDYISAVCQWLPLWHAEGLLDAVDAFCERIGFSPAQVRRVFDVAARLGLPVKLHAEQLSDSGGAALAASYRALSCDHLEHLSDEGIAAMAGSATVAMLLPGAYYFLRETQAPPIAKLRAAGVPMALATDHNPGSSPALSLVLMLNMACTLFRLTPLEAFEGVTRHAAQALGLQSSHGTLEAGKRADFVVWDAEHPRELAYAFGAAPARRVVCAGQEWSPEDGSIAR